MIRALLLAAALTLAGAAAHADGMYKMDAKGGCHDASGKYAKKEMCKAPMAAMAYKMDAKGKCRDAKGRFAKQDLCKKP